MDLVSDVDETPEDGTDTADNREVKRNIEDNREVEMNTEDNREVEMNREDNREVEMNREDNREVKMNTEDNREVEMNREDNREVKMNIEDNREVEMNTEDNREVEMNTEDNREVEMNTEGNREVEMNTEDNGEVEMNTEDNREVERHSGDKRTSEEHDVCSITNVSEVGNTSDEKDTENQSEMDETAVVVSDVFSVSNKVSGDGDNPDESDITNESGLCNVKTEDDDLSSSEVQSNFKVQKDKRTTKYHPCEFPGCTKSFSRPDRLRKHALVHTNNREFTCSFFSCSKSYTTAQHLRRHYTAVHLSDPGMPPPVPCDNEQCDKVFQHKDSMKKHYQKHHVNVKPRHACDKCSASFYYRAEYYKHLYETHGTEMIKCDKCDIVFTRQTDKTRHMRGHRTYICEEPECNGITFERFNDKRKHDSIVHPILYTCYHCDFTAQRKFFLEEHMYSKHLPRWERPLLLCSFENCQRTFHHARNYVIHFKKKHLNENTSFVCPLGCPQTFATKQSCQRHVKVMHMDKGGAPQEELPFSCEYCYKKFGRQYNVRRHYLRMHASIVNQAHSSETTEYIEEIQN